MRSGTSRGTRKGEPPLDADALELDAEDSLRVSTLSDSQDEEQAEDDAVDALRFERGATIDRYIVLDRVGAGAMGVVYTAYDPRLDRRIALKVMHARGGAQADVVTRVLREAQALAKLSHPNVVAVYDANVVGEAVYLTMELIKGVSLTQWLKHGPRSVAAVLRVFIQAGRGLAGAHAAGLIHRDFKPDNVLVGDDGRVRVVDFGIARGADGPEMLSVDQALEASRTGTPVTSLKTPPQGTQPGESPVQPFASTDRGQVPGFGRGGGVADTQRAEMRADGTPPPRLQASQLETAIPGLSSIRLTRTGALVGTPAYMAPEQHIAARVDARADQFAFCIALYEALFGCHPFPARNYFQLSLSKLGGKVDPMIGRADVPVHVRKAILRGLLVDPDERFPDMEALLTVLSFDPDLRKRRRIAAALIAGGTASLLALVGMEVFGGGPTCESAERHLAGVYDQPTRADIERAFLATGQPFAPKVLESTLGGLDRWSTRWLDMRREACEATHVHHEQSTELLDRRMACLDRQLRRLAATAGVLRGADGPTVLHAVEAVDALPELDECSDRERLMRGEVLTAAQQAANSEVEDLLGRAEASRLAVQYPAARTLAAEAQAQAQAQGLRRGEVQALLSQGRVLRNLGQVEGAEGAFTRADELAERIGSDDLRAEASSELGGVLGNMLHQTAEAERLLRRSAAVLDRIGGSRIQRARVSEQLGAIVAERGRLDEALALLDAAATIAEATTDANSTGLVSILNTRGTVYERRGETELALADYARALAVCEARLGPEHPDVAAVLNNMALVEETQGRHELARAQLERSLQIRRRALGEEHPVTATTRMNLGTLSLNTGDYEAAVTEFEQALVVLSRVQGVDADVADIRYNLGIAQHLRNQYDLALPHYRAALELTERMKGADHPDVAYPLTGLGGALVELHRDVEARELLERALAIRSREGVAPVDIGELRFALARAVLQVDRDRAIVLATQARGDYDHDGDKDQVLVIDGWLKDQVDRRR
ncbi:MAG: tetratricopeptide repeat protein [Nannocystis sp.]|nr:tetratricopeptide repeat protein [Nannocystis sp.]